MMSLFIVSCGPDIIACGVICGRHGSRDEHKTFLKNHTLQFGVLVSQHLSTSSSNTERGIFLSAECLFFDYFGREETAGSMRSRTTNTKYYHAPFRAEMYRQHLINQNPGRWQQQQDANHAGKRTFFEEQLPMKQILHEYFGTKKIEIIFLINLPIFDVIIGEMIWDPKAIKD